MLKIAVFSDLYNGPRFCKAAQSLGYQPFLFVVHADKDCLNYVVIDPTKNAEELGEIIEASISGVPDAVICCIEQLCVKIAQYATYRKIAINDIECYKNLRDKKRMKEKWVSDDVRTARAIYCRHSTEIPYSTLTYPIIVKPTLGAASAGVKICYSKEELEKQINNIFRFNAMSLLNEEKKSGLLLEEYISGMEYSVDTIWRDGIPYLDGIMVKGNPEGPLFPDRLYMRSNNIDESTVRELLDISHQAVRSASVRSGATHTEIRVKDENGYVIESALRPGAGGCFYGLFDDEDEYLFYKALVIASIPYITSEEKETLEKLRNAAQQKNESVSYWYNIGYKGRGVIRNIYGTDDIRQLEHVDMLQIHKKQGDYLSAECDSFVYFGWIIGKFMNDDFDMNYLKMQETEKLLRIEYK